FLAARIDRGSECWRVELRDSLNALILCATRGVRDVHVADGDGITGSAQCGERIVQPAERGIERIRRTFQRTAHAVRGNSWRRIPRASSGKSSKRCERNHDG